MVDSESPFGEARRAARTPHLLGAKSSEAEQSDISAVLCAEIAHELTDLVTTISGNLAMIARVFQPGDPLLERVDDIRASALRAAELTRHLHAYAQASRCRLRAADINAVIRESLPAMRAALPAGAIVRTQLARRLPELACDRGRFRQMLVQLCRNAAESGADRPHLAVQTERAAEHDLAALRDAASGIRLSFIDKGAAISPEVRAGRIDPSALTGRRGRALQLAVVQQIVQAHGGVARVESTTGAGASFVILLPGRNVQRQPAEPPEPSRAPRRRPG
jgi:signal transduction histidine kinase